MVIVLVAGDSFHLVPRIRAQLTNTMDLHVRALGFGKLVTSITMTAFYVLLYAVWLTVSGTRWTSWLTAMVLLLAFVRVVLCCFPQNRWLDKNPPLSWAIYRNIPFALLGALIVVLFAVTSLPAIYSGLQLMWLAVTLSFLFYLPVVLFADKHPKIGMLMIPKTCAYIWIICMGFSLV